MSGGTTVSERVQAIVTWRGTTGEISLRSNGGVSGVAIVVNNGTLQFNLTLASPIAIDSCLPIASPRRLLEFDPGGSQEGNFDTTARPINTTTIGVLTSVGDPIDPTIIEELSFSLIVSVMSPAAGPERVVGSYP